VADGATVPIYYESRLARIELPEEEKPRIDAEIAELTGKYGSVEAVVGSEKRLALVAADLINHAEARFVALDGKAMLVCMLCSHGLSDHIKSSRGTRLYKTHTENHGTNLFVVLFKFNQAL
jgi:type I site-specific restriction-modification system R (restriction) subunit